MFVNLLGVAKRTDHYKQQHLNFVGQNSLLLIELTAENDISSL